MIVIDNKMRGDLKQLPNAIRCPAAVLRDIVLSGRNARYRGKQLQGAMRCQAISRCDAVYRGVTTFARAMRPP